MKRLIPKSHFQNKERTVDSVKARINRQGDKTNLPLYERFQQAWTDLHPMRATRMRNIRYVRGDQWSDFVIDDNGKLVRERERIARRTGGVVLQNNHLIKIVNTLTGLYSKTATMPVCYAREADADQKSQMMTKALKTNWDNNEMKDLLTSEMFEFIVGGVAISKELWNIHNEVDDSYTYMPDVSHMAWEMEGSDPRHWDICMIGEIKDYTKGELAATYAKSEYDYNQLETIYAPYMNLWTTSNEKNDYDEESFTTPPANNLCRVYEIWTKEHKPCIRCKDIMDIEHPLYHVDVEELPLIIAENKARLKMGLEQGLSEDEIPLIEYERITYDDGKDNGLGWREYEYWHFQALAPNGLILDEYDSPFEHGSHPYTLKMHLYTNGQVTPFISCVIDQQRYINRLITLNDLLINSSIKGLKLIPKECVPEGMSEREFAERAVDIGGWIFYEASKTQGAVPQVIATNSTNIGISDLLQVEMNSISDITNVNDALQGKSPSSGTSASRYMMETQNSTTSIATILSKFSAFENNLARKKMKTIHQYYQEPRCISVEQNNGYTKFEMYDPKLVKDIDFDVKIGESVESPVARMLTNETLEQWASNGWIDLKDLLEYGYFPNLAELKQKIAATEEAAQEQQGAAPQQGNMPAPQAANPNTVQQIQSILKQ